MIRICLCFYGWNRRSNPLRNVEQFLKPYFNLDDLHISITYATYDTESDDDHRKVLEQDLLPLFYKNNPNVKDVKTSIIPYDETYFLKEIKQNINRIKSFSNNFFLHRQISMYTSMKRAFDLIDTPVDYVIISRLDWGVNDISQQIPCDIKSLLRVSKPNGVISGHLNGNRCNQVGNLLASDPRFMLSTYDNMNFISSLPSLFLEYLSNLKTSETYIMNDHAFISHVIVNHRNLNVLGHRTMFKQLTHSPYRIQKNHKINLNDDEYNRILKIFEKI